MQLKLNDEKVMIAQDYLEKFSWDLADYGAYLDRWFERAMKKWFFFERFPAKWIKFYLMEDPNLWPTELTPLEVELLKLSRLMFAAYGERVYVDKAYGIDPSKPDRTYEHDITVNGLKYWAESFTSKVVEPLVEDYFTIRNQAGMDLLEYCEKNNERCTLKETKTYFQYSSITMCQRGKTMGLSSTEESIVLQFFKVYNKV